MRDADVRSAVLTYLSGLHGGESDTRIVEEMGIWSGAVRIDIAVINGELCGFELKSDRDTLERLPTQSDLYSRVFDRLTLVVGSRHLDGALSKIPDWWGVIRATDHEGLTGLERVRDDGINPTPVPYLIANLLWKDEALAILLKHGLHKGLKSKAARAVHEKMAESLPLETLRLEVRQALKDRQRSRQVVSYEGQVTI